MRNIENLKLSFPELEDSVKQSTKGGWGGYSDGGSGGGWGIFGGFGSPSNPFHLPPITITPSGPRNDPSRSPGYTPGGNPYWWGGQTPWGHWGYGNQGQDQGGGGGGGGNGTADPNDFNWRDGLSTAITAGLAATEGYATLDMARLGTLPQDAKGLLANLLDTNPTQTFTDLVGDIKQLKGIAILDAAGKALGVWAAAESLYKLGEDILDGNGVDPMNVADAAVNVGSLFVKSNLVGITVSLGWMIVKTTIDSDGGVPISSPATTGVTTEGPRPDRTGGDIGGGRPSRGGSRG